MTTVALNIPPICREIFDHNARTYLEILEESSEPRQGERQEAAALVGQLDGPGPFLAFPRVADEVLNGSLDQARVEIGETAMYGQMDDERLKQLKRATYRLLVFAREIGNTEGTLYVTEGG